MDYMNLIIMVIVGAIAGSLAAQIMRGNSLGFVVNSILGIAGAVVGGMIFNFLGISPGSGIVKVVSDTFGVNLSPKLVGMIVSGTIGAIIILWATRVLRGRG